MAANRELIGEIWQLFNLMREAPEEEMQPFIYGLVDVLPFIAQTTHDPSAVFSINLSVDNLIEKCKGELSKGAFCTQLNVGNTADIEGCIKQSSEFKEDEKSQALEC
ncbi:hypothetical protein QUS22_03650 [Wolbachia pipientis]|nr:hypothetical protein [Wolbachia pipientis]